jgi:hypothetical protein
LGSTEAEGGKVKISCRQRRIPDIYGLGPKPCREIPVRPGIFALSMIGIPLLQMSSIKPSRPQRASIRRFVPKVGIGIAAGLVLDHLVGR